MPPFPRASNTEPTRSIEATPTSPDPSTSTEPPRSDASPASDTSEAGEPPSPESQSGDTPEAESDDVTGLFDADGEEWEPFPEDEDALSEEGPDPEAIYDDEDPDFDDDDEDSEEPASFRSTVTAELARRAEKSLLNGMEHVADTFDETAHRIGRIAQLRGGQAALTLGPVHSTVGWLEGAADYLRTSDLEAVQSDLRDRVRARPVQSLGIALCAGWLLGKILR